MRLIPLLVGALASAVGAAKSSLRAESSLEATSCPWASYLNPNCKANSKCLNFGCSLSAAAPGTTATITFEPCQDPLVIVTEFGVDGGANKTFKILSSSFFDTGLAVGSSGNLYGLVKMELVDKKKKKYDIALGQKICTKGTSGLKCIGAGNVGFLNTTIKFDTYNCGHKPAPHPVPPPSPIPPIGPIGPAPPQPPSSQPPTSGNPTPPPSSNNPPPPPSTSGGGGGSPTTGGSPPPSSGGTSGYLAAEPETPAARQQKPLGRAGLKTRAARKL